MQARLINVGWRAGEIRYCCTFEWSQCELVEYQTEYEVHMSKLSDIERLKIY